MRRAELWILAALLAVLCASRRVGAQPAPNAQALILDQGAALDFTPTRAFFLAATGGEVKKYGAEILNPSPAADETAVQWRFGAAIEVPAGAAAVDFRVLAQGAGDRCAYLPPRRWIVSGREAFGGSTDALRKTVLDRKRELASWQVQVKAQDESIKRLRADAEVIGELGRIAEVAEEAERIQSELDNLAKDMANSQRLVKLASRMGRPKNFEGRQAMLTRQLDELALVVHNAERGEILRRAAGASDLQQQLAIIEAARGEDQDRLQSELAQLRALRTDLERQHGASRSSARRGEDYAPPAAAQ